MLPGDCILLQNTNITCDESNLTGEPDHVRKEIHTADTAHLNPDSFMLEASTVMSGKGLAVVCSVGESTFSGQAASALEDDEDSETPLQKKLGRIADEIGKIGVYCALLTFTAMTINLVIQTVIEEDPFVLKDFIAKIMDFFILGITIIVVAVPEGLPMAVTIALAYSVNKMKQEQNLVRQLAASETMGGAQEICTDKTGTLTQNKMSLVELFSENNSTVKGEGYSESTIEILHESISVNSTANLVVGEDGRNQRLGNQTECGLLEFVKNAGADYLAIRRKFPELHTTPFTSSRKRMSLSIAKGDDTVRVYVKGASEVVLQRCCRYIGEGG